MLSYLRFLYRNKLYTLVNVLGFAVSLMFVILIADYAWRQNSTDSWNKNKDRIFLLGTHSSFYSWPEITSGLAESFPEIEKMCGVMSHHGKVKSDLHYYESDDEPFILLADSTFFDFFDFKFVIGDKATAMDSPDKCVITESMAQQLFNDEYPIGKSLTIIGARDVIVGGQDSYDTTVLYTVSAVIKDFDKTVLPNETKIIVNMDRHPQTLGYTLNKHLYAYGSTGYYKSFMMLRPDADMLSNLDAVTQYYVDNIDMYNYGKQEKITVTPLGEIMFAPQNDGYGLEKGNKGLLTILLSAVIALLLFAVMNYINLTVANTGFRSKEMATRRLLGSSVGNIFITLIVESIFLVTVSFLIAFFFAYNFQNEFATLIKGRIILKNDITVGTVSICLAFIILTGVISGIIPSIQMMRYKPINVIKGAFRYHSKMVLSRIFIIVQNVITIVLVVASLVMILQIRHLTNAPLGFETKNIYYIYYPENYDVLGQELAKLTCVDKIGAFSGSSFAGYNRSYNSFTDENGKKQVFLLTELDSEAMEIYGIEFIKDEGCKKGAIYVNETGLHSLGLDENNMSFVVGDKHFDLAGIVADFHFNSILNNPSPLIITIEDRENLSSYIVKTDGSYDAYREICNVIAEVEGYADAGSVSGMVLSVEELISMEYEDMRNTLKIVELFTFIAIIISMLGLVGMSVFYFYQKRKEIALRKIMGSTTKEVTWLTLKNFCAPIVVSAIIAIPLSWYIMNGWLENYSYRISWTPWIFVVAIIFTFVIAVLSVLFQILKATRENPVKYIKTE